MSMTPAQCRAARALLACNQADLAAKASLGLSTVVDFERKRRAVSEEAITAIRSTLEAEGVLISQNGGTEGVALGYAVRSHPLLKSGIGEIVRVWLFETKSEARAFVVGALAELKRRGATLGYRPLHYPDYFWARGDGVAEAYTFAGAPAHSEKLALCSEVGIKNTDED